MNVQAHLISTAYYEPLSDTLGPIDHLPDELLLHVFYLCCFNARHAEPCSTRHPWWDIAAVCMRWRSLALSEPRLWSMLELNLNNDRHYSELTDTQVFQRCRRLAAQIERCGTEQPLDIIKLGITVAHCYDHLTEVQEVLDLLVRQLPRAKELELCDHVYRISISSATPLPMLSNLRSLGVDDESWLRPELLTEHNTPCLSSLVLTNMALDGQPPSLQWTNITNLFLQSCTLTADALPVLFRCAPNLEILFIDEYLWYPPSGIRKPRSIDPTQFASTITDIPAQLDRLRIMELDIAELPPYFTEKSYEAARDTKKHHLRTFLERGLCRAPNLIALHVYNITEEGAVAVHTFITTSNPIFLTHLSLGLIYPNATPPLLIAMLAHLPALKHLEVEQSQFKDENIPEPSQDMIVRALRWAPGSEALLVAADIPDAIDGVPAERTLCPRLTHLVISNCNISFDVLRTTILSRTSAFLNTHDAESTRCEFLRKVWVPSTRLVVGQDRSDEMELDTLSREIEEEAARYGVEFSNGGESFPDIIARPGIVCDTCVYYARHYAHGWQLKRRLPLD